MYPTPLAPATNNSSSQSHQTSGNNHDHHLIGYSNGDDNTCYNYSNNVGSHATSYRSLAGEGGAVGGGASSWSASCLIRQSSSPPAGFFQHLSSDSGIPHKGGESYNHPQAISSHIGHNKQSKLNSQMNFTKHDSIDHRLSSNHPNLKKSWTSSHPNRSHGFTISPWEEEFNSIILDTSSSNPQIGLSEIENIDKSHVPKGSVAWRVRAKRGCATHPRSIAERERRIRISCKLKKLQELVPNIDKQTSYAELLDMAVQHIEDLQSQLQKLDEELGSCTCGCKHEK